MLTFRAHSVLNDNIERYEIKTLKKKTTTTSAKSKTPSEIVISSELKIKKAPVSCLELNPFWQPDKKAFQRILKIWGDRAELLPFMNSMFQYIGDSTTDVKTRFFALTRQDEDFEDPKPEQFLCLAQATELNDGTVSVDAVQVNPFYLFNNPYSDLKKVGKTMMNAIKNIFANKELILFSPRENVPFFELSGFEIAKSNANREEIFMKLKNTVCSKIAK